MGWVVHMSRPTVSAAFSSRVMRPSSSSIFVSVLAIVIMASLFESHSVHGNNDERTRWLVRWTASSRASFRSEYERRKHAFPQLQQYLNGGCNGVSNASPVITARPPVYLRLSCLPQQVGDAELALGREKFLTRFEARILP